MHTLLPLANSTPAIPEPSLRPGLSADQIGPGFLGFVVTFAIVVVMFFLIRDMIKRIRRVRYREQVQQGRAGGTHGPGAPETDLDETGPDETGPDGGAAAGANGTDVGKPDVGGPEDPDRKAHGRF